LFGTKGFVVVVVVNLPLWIYISMYPLRHVITHYFCMY
jgi:hypothetical protein